MEITKLFRDFFDSERSAGYVLIFSTLLSLLLANLFIGDAYPQFFHVVVGPDKGVIHLRMSLEHWVNDGLMTIFFLLVGLEIERELYVGELSSPRQAMLPIVAAVGGMLVPALIHYAFNRGTATESGFGIPMATDIAFALGVLSLGGSRVPVSLKIFLTALAIIDDLGAITVIALFYTHGFSLAYFAAAIGLFLVLFVLGRRGVNSLALYLPAGVLLWYFMLQSGVHASIAGVLLAFAIPFNKIDSRNSSYHLQHVLHKPVAFLILPVFALVNTAIVIPAKPFQLLLSANGAGIALGLVAGKFLGIFGAAVAGRKARLVAWPAAVSGRQLASVALLGGIGFTMSIFISNLAFRDAATVTGSKMVILASALVSALAGLALLHSTQPKKR
ncbi:Na+/H+ antiporter NhaA [Flaviaesturariibacter terrae]